MPLNAGKVKNKESKNIPGSLPYDLQRLSIVTEEDTLEDIQVRMHGIVERQKDILKLMKDDQPEDLVSEFKELGEVFARLSSELMNRYFKK
jgi:hypothetical protein